MASKVWDEITYPFLYFNCMQNIDLFDQASMC